VVVLAGGSPPAAADHGLRPCAVGGNRRCAQPDGDPPTSRRTPTWWAASSLSSCPEPAHHRSPFPAGSGATARAGEGRTVPEVGGPCAFLLVNERSAETARPALLDGADRLHRHPRHRDARSDGLLRQHGLQL
jgi:hypothetical protein